jgi:hypothetical protein
MRFAMKVISLSAIGLLLLVEAASAQSLGDLARKERQRKAQEQKATIQLSTDELRIGKFDVSPALDPARKSDLDYLLQQLSHPKASPELLGALVPLKDRAVPRLIALIFSTDPFKRVAPATALTALGSSEGLTAMARLLGEATEAAQSAPASPPAASTQTPDAAKGTPTTTGPAPSSDEELRRKIEQSRLFAYALEGTKFGVWRFTEGSPLTPEQVVQRLQTGTAIQVVGGVDNGQRIFNRALRDPDPNLRRGAIALVRVATQGPDYGFEVDQTAAQNESAIQQITSFLTTERGKVMSQLAAKNP